MKRLAALYGGSLPEHRTFAEPKYRRWLAEVIYLLDLPATDLGRLDGLLVSEGLHRGRLRAAGQIQGFLARGRTVLLLGNQFDSQPSAWLPGLDWRPTVGQSSQLVAHHRDHSFHRRVPLEVAALHHHGTFRPPAGAETLLATEDGGAVLYIDRVSTPGTLLVAAMDPIAHFGESLLRDAEQFLDRFLPWVVEELL
jgi:hypothetical protein